MRNAFAPIRFFDIHAVSALLLTAETPGLARVPAPVGVEFGLISCMFQPNKLSAQLIRRPVLIDNAMCFFMSLVQ